MHCLYFSLCNFSVQQYTGNVQTFTAPLSTTYKLEVWGAQGGGWGYHTNAPGGYAGGWKNLTKNQVLYVVVGGKGIDANHYTDGTSYNGGGIGSNNLYIGGGGATHIATASGLLKDLVNNKSSVVCVAGGAGTNGRYASDDSRYYQSGGGLVGLGSPTTYYITSTETAPTKGDTGGTQTGCGPDGIKGGFGFGGSPTEMEAGAGGGGWYGGNASGGGGVHRSVGGGGGSGYIGGLTNGRTIAGNASMPSPTGGTETGHYGNGYAIISWHPNI